MNARQFMLMVQQVFIEQLKVEPYFGDLKQDFENTSLLCTVVIPERSYSFELSVPLDPEYLEQVLRSHASVEAAASMMVSNAISLMNSRKILMPNVTPDMMAGMRPPMTVLKWPEL